MSRHGEERLYEVWQQSEALGDMLEEILDFSRLEAEQRSLEREECSPREILEEAIDMLTAHGVSPRKVTLDVGPDLPRLEADRRGLVRAVYNLLDNAAKYGALSNKTGQIAVDWQITADADGSKAFELTWRELGGPPSREAVSSGFGTVVLLRVAPQAMSASGEVVYGEGGLVWRFRAPLSTIQATDDG